MSSVNNELPNPFDIRRTILSMLYRGGASHVGPCMSMVEVLTAAYSCVDLDGIRHAGRDRDRIFVSKGHSAAALYAVMHHFGLLERELLGTYHLDGSLLAGHVSHAIKGVEHSTGALGHGLSVACGAALAIRALRAQGMTTRRPLIVTIVGDGEIQEGSIWESLMFACHQRLPMLIVVDNNRAIQVLEQRLLAPGFGHVLAPLIVVPGFCLFLGFPQVDAAGVLVIFGHHIVFAGQTFHTFVLGRGGGHLLNELFFISNFHWK